jgi:hypothetical protein
MLKKVLLEEFTGHMCPNCPKAGETARKLHDFYGNRLIIISYHTGFYARTSTAFPVDYRTNEGDALNSFFKVQFYPSGMVNRSLSGQTQLMGPVDWSESIASQFRKKPGLTLEITPSFNRATGNFRTDIKLKLLSTSSSALRLCLFLTEDSLVSAQSISGDPRYPSGFIQDYLHMHVFRTSLTGTWGEPVFESGMGALTEKTVSCSGVLDSRYIPGNCHWVAFVISDADKTVQQAESVRLIP